MNVPVSVVAPSPRRSEKVRSGDIVLLSLAGRIEAIEAVTCAQPTDPIRHLLNWPAHKLTRSLPLQTRMEAGRVWLPKDQPWVGELERELLGFPNGARDDQVDALSYAEVLAGRLKRRWVAY